MHSEYAWALLSLHSLAKWLNLCRYEISLILLALGGFLAFFGGRYYKATFFIFGQLGLTIYMMLYFYITLLPSYTPVWTVWFALILALTFSSGLGLICMTYARVGVLVVGATLGGLLGGIFFKILVYVISGSNPYLGLYLTILFFAIIMAVVCFVFFDFAVIIASTIFGSYFLVRGVSIFIGHFPSELVVIKTIELEESTYTVNQLE